MTYIPASGPHGASIMVIGDCPSSTETVSLTNRETHTVLREAGISIDNVWRSNVSKYHVPPSPGDAKIPFEIRAERAGIDLVKCIEELQVEINSIKPNVILALGRAPLRALTGKNNIENYRGSILNGMGRKVVATYNPAQLNQYKDVEFKGYYNRQVIIFDCKRALAESYNPSIELPSRNLQVCRNSAQLYEFIRRNDGRVKPAVDIEALNCIPSCIGIAFTPNDGISVPLWNHRQISHIPNSDLVSIWILLSQVLSEHEVIMQNGKYDEDKLRRLGFSIKVLASDTMLKAFAINPELPKSLAFNTSIYTREPYYKDEGADFNISKQSIDDLFIYNARDACVTKEIDLAMDADLDSMGMRDYYENFIMKLHPLYLDIESVGFRIDEQARDRLLRKYIAWDEKLRYELFQLTGAEINVNSPKDVPNLLQGVYHLPITKGTGEEELTKIFNSPKTKDEPREAIRLILEDRSVRKSISTYLMALPDYDNRMRTTYYLCLETGRTSTGQQDPPIRPTVEVIDFDGKKKKKVLGTAFQTMTKHGDIGADIREMYIPDDGEIFIQADSSQAEARVIFLLADDEDALKDIDTHDYHALTASWFFGGTESDYSKKVLGYESPIRFAGKTLRHAGHLGAQKKRAATELNTQARKYKIPISITEAIADRALTIFHSKQPKIRGVFHAGIIEAMKTSRMLVAPVPYGIDAKIGPKRQFFERFGDELFRQAFSYLPQRAVTDNTKAAGIRIKRRVPDIKIIVEAHDALLFSVPIPKVQEYSKIIKEEFERPINFDNCSLSRRSLSIPCEIETGMDYCNLSKFKGITDECKL